MTQHIKSVMDYIAHEKQTLLQHPIYQKINSIEHIIKFTEGHVYAVWDFMSLLKALQQKLTCITIPWTPTLYPNTRYLINDMVLAEESDEYIDGKRLSHYEMYIDTMRDLGADTKPIEYLIAQLSLNDNIITVINQSNLDKRIKDFLSFTFNTIQRGNNHEIASAFSFGREGLIPSLFSNILKGIRQSHKEEGIDKLIYYFQRHIDLDEDHHAPMAFKMLEELCENDITKWNEVNIIAKESLTRRISLWDAIYDTITI